TPDRSRSFGKSWGSKPLPSALSQAPSLGPISSARQTRTPHLAPGTSGRISLPSGGLMDPARPGEAPSHDTDFAALWSSDGVTRSLAPSLYGLTADSPCL